MRPTPIMRADEIHPGDLIAGKYRVRAVLGRGHGLLVEAFHTEFDQRVVIKVLLAGSGDEREIERFRREARVLSKLASEHAARIIDVGTEGDGSFYLVREYLDGVDLGSYVAQRGPLPLVDAVLCVLQVAECVAETHSHGIIVRELSPSHLFLTQRAGGAPLVKISDFGTAKLMREAAAPGVGGELTATAMFGLSPYSSPELLRKARNVDARTDVWSLGAIFYELVTGRPPFSGEPTALMLQISRDEPARATRLVHGLPAEIDQIIGWSLAKDVDARFKNVHAFAHALAPFASAEGQVMIERIAQISERSRAARLGASAPPSFPSARAPEAPVTLPPPATRSEPVAAEESITDVRIPKAPPVPAMRALPPPPHGQPMGALPEAMPAAAHPSAPPRVIGAPVQPAHSATSRAALWIIAVAAVLVPVLAILLVLKRSPAPAEPEAVPTATAIASAPPAPTEPAVVEPSAAPSAPEPGASAPAAPSAPEPPSEPSASAAPSAEPSAKPTSKPSRVAAPSPPPAAGPTGTLLAVVVGGSCSFQVNGASKGSGTSLRLSLKPGTYSVVCRPASGAVKSKSVTVRSGETAMAAFKL